MHMSTIERLAIDILDQRELQLADRLALLLGYNRWDASSLIGDIIPIYWEQVGDRLRNLSPGIIYRPLYYVYTFGSKENFKDETRAFMTSISGHLEGCLLSLARSPSEYRSRPGPFGRLVGPLKSAGFISDELADQLRKFNEAINVSSKHFDAYMPTNWLDERTFSVKETAYAFLIMRKLSIQLFAFLKASGVVLPQGWPDFKTEWLTWSRKINGSPEPQ